MEERTMRFLVDFRKRAEQKRKEVSVQEMTLGELLYYVLMGEDRLQESAGSGA